MIEVKKFKSQKGFTLIELLVVIAIIGILSSVILASLNSARGKGQDAARISNLKSFKLALEMYYDDNNGYPTSNGSVNGDVLLSDSVLKGKLVPNYISSISPLLISDGVRYYTNGATSGVSTAYDMLFYLAKTNSWCRTGTLPGNTGDWGVSAVCSY